MDSFVRFYDILTGGRNLWTRFPACQAHLLQLGLQNLRSSPLAIAIVTWARNFHKDMRYHKAILTGYVYRTEALQIFCAGAGPKPQELKVGFPSAPRIGFPSDPRISFPPVPRIGFPSGPRIGFPSGPRIGSPSVVATSVFSEVESPELFVLV